MKEEEEGHTKAQVEEEGHIEVEGHNVSYGDGPQGC